MVFPLFIEIDASISKSYFWKMDGLRKFSCSASSDPYFFSPLAFVLEG